MTHILEGKRVKRTDWRIQGEGPDPPIRSDACLKLKLLHWQDHISLSNWLIFLMKCRLHFATKLNPRAIQKCNCFWVSSWSVCLCLQSSISCTNRERCSQIEKHVVVSAFSAGHKKVQQSFWTNVWTPPTKSSWIRPCKPILIFQRCILSSFHMLHSMSCWKILGFQPCDNKASIVDKIINIFWRVSTKNSVVLSGRKFFCSCPPAWLL